jgi:hypothetical protein
MSVIIHNMGSLDGTQDGNHQYSLKVNNELICTFEHRRSEGLAKCLKRAAEAAYWHEKAGAKHKPA